jgi:ribose 5-phosphate isomerase B
MPLTVALAADHAGFELKERLKAAIAESGHAVLDLGTHSRDRVDYPDFAARMGEAIGEGAAEFGVLVCGTGIGISIAANRYRHVRAALCHDVTTARLAREHNDANVLALGARTVGPDVALDCVRTFLSSRFAAGRHAERVAKLG